MMITQDVAILVMTAVAVTAGGTYYMFSHRYYERGLQHGFGFAIKELVQDGFMQSEKDEDGDDALVMISEIKSRVRKEERKYYEDRMRHRD